MYIRDARPSDGRELLDIYAYYVTNTAISFETTPPSLEEFTRRIQKIQDAYPYIIAKGEGKMLGYAYAAPFKDRAAYDWSCEVTIYLDKSARFHGLGPVLYSELEKRLRDMGIINMYACIAVPREEDEFLTANSRRVP